MKTQTTKGTTHTPRPRPVYEALPNDANDKRAPGSWKVCVREYDADGLMIRAQKYAQEIYSEAHARKIASALNEDAAAPETKRQLDIMISRANTDAVAWSGMAEANARLIAAAPDLLAALKTAAATATHERICEFEPGNGLCACRVAIFRAAILRAEDK